MIRAIAMDASTWWSGVALVEFGDGDTTPVVVAEIGLRVRDSHAVHLLALLERLLSEADWPRSAVDAYAATRGPGSFTGLRVGLGTVRGLALASSRPAVGVGTLDAMAEAFGPADRDRVPLLDAGRKQAYGARFDPAGSPPHEIAPAWMGACQLALPPGSREPVLFGNGAIAYEPDLREAGYRGLVSPGSAAVAGGAARIAAWRVRQGARDGDGMSPLYIRPADAERADEEPRG